MTDLEALAVEQARALTDRIRVALEGTWLLIQEAYTSRAWATLGYDTWDAYVDAEFRTARLALPKEERAETIQSLRSAGMSVRAISSATGVGYGTVQREIAATDPSGSVETVQGVNGKSYEPTRPSPAQAPPSDTDLMAGAGWVQPQGDGFEDAVTPPAAPAKPKRRPLTEAFAEAGHDLTKVTDRLARLADDDRFPRNRDQTHHQVPELLGALDQLAHLVTAMRLHEAQASEEARRWWATSLNTISSALTGAAHSITKEH